MEVAEEVLEKAAKYYYGKKNYAVAHQYLS